MSAFSICIFPVVGIKILWRFNVFIVIFTWFVWEIPNWLLPPAPCWLLLCSAVPPLPRADRAAEDGVVLWFQPSLLSLKQYHWLNFDGWFQALSPGSHLRGDGMRRFRTAKGRQNTMRCFKENTLKLDEECLVSLYTADFSFQQWQKSLGACEKPPPTPDFCVLQFSVPRDGPDK